MVTMLYFTIRDERDIQVTERNTSKKGVRKRVVYIPRVGRKAPREDPGAPYYPMKCRKGHLHPNRRQKTQKDHKEHKRVLYTQTDDSQKGQERMSSRPCILPDNAGSGKTIRSRISGSSLAFLSNYRTVFISANTLAEKAMFVVSMSLH